MKIFLAILITYLIAGMIIAYSEQRNFSEGVRYGIEKSAPGIFSPRAKTVVAFMFVQMIVIAWPFYMIGCSAISDSMKKK